MRRSLIIGALAVALAGCASAPHTGPATVFTPSGMPTSAASPSIPGLPVVVPPSTAGPAPSRPDLLCSHHPVRNVLRNWQCSPH